MYFCTILFRTVLTIPCKANWNQIAFECFENKSINIFKKYLCLNVSVGEGKEWANLLTNCAFPFVTLKWNITTGLTFCKESWQSTFQEQNNLKADDFFFLATSYQRFFAWLQDYISVLKFLKHQVLGLQRNNAYNLRFVCTEGKVLFKKKLLPHFGTLLNKFSQQRLRKNKYLGNTKAASSIIPIQQY